MNNTIRSGRLFLSLSLALLLSPLSAYAENEGWDRWEMFIGTGTGFSKKTPLDIHHPNGDIHIAEAEYETKPWGNLAPYYDIRFARWSDDGNTAWEAELHHHKLHLTNNHPDVQEFVISHGYNMVTLNHLWKMDGYILRAGAGTVMTHPEIIVYDQTFDAEAGGFYGFYFNGWTVQLGIEKRYPIQSGWFKGASIFTEAKVTSSRTTIPIANGTADVPNSAIHGLIGLVTPLNLFFD